MRSGLIPMMRASVASTAGKLAPTTISPIGLRLPMIGPSPSMQSMPSTIASGEGSDALMSNTVCGNAGVVQHILRPAVHDPRQHAVKILHAAR